MEQSIWKFSLKIDDSQQVELPVGAELLCVQMQRGQPQLWAKVNPKAKKETVEIRLYGTGQPLPPNPGKYISTVQQFEGQLVWHFFVR